MDPLKSARKGKEREFPRDAPQPTDLDEKLLAFRRRTAGPPRSKEKTERERLLPPALPARSLKHTSVPSSTISKPPQISHRRAPQTDRAAFEADPEEFSRRLNISTPPPATRSSAVATSKQMQGKLYNPNTDPIPVRRNAEPDSDVTSSSYVHVPRAAPAPAPAHTSPHPRERDGNAHPRQLFDHRRDDPVRFSVLARPQQGSQRAHAPVDYMSASSSSYAPSISSSFTLTSTTDNSSASSALFDRANAPKGDEAASNAFANKLKRLYREIVSYETKIQQEDAAEEDNGRSMQGKQLVRDAEEKEKEKWDAMIDVHKKLADVVHNLLEISLSPSVPSSLRYIPTKYNIIVRLWTFSFHKLLESLRRASFTSPMALEHLQSFIYYAYKFYTGLYEEPNLGDFRSGWLEALGDLARYRMAVAAMVNSQSFGGNRLTAASLSEVPHPSKPDQGGPKSVSDVAAARIDDSAPPSIGIAAARALEVEPEKERWRQIARDWYSRGLAELPGSGKLHHHLGLLCREVESEELKGAYHFLKSLTTQQPFTTARESVLPIWSVAAQARRSQPDARVPELFVLLHGMLFTNIQLDDFQPTLARLIERLTIDGADEREWIMMAIINITALLEYGKTSGVIRGIKTAGAATVKVMTKSRSTDDRMDVDEAERNEGMMLVPSVNTQPSPAPSDVDEAPELPTAFTLALQLTFAILSFALRNPLRRPTPHSQSTLNPYIGIILTFITTMAKKSGILEVLERSVPWEELASFFQTVPSSIIASQSDKKWPMLTSDCKPPLNEDWCMRGMEWIAKKVFIQGYFKIDPDTLGERPNDQRMELEVLEVKESVALMDCDGQIEDDDDGKSKSSRLDQRWIRVFRCGVDLSKMVNGFTYAGGRRWSVEGQLAEKVKQWREQDEIARLEEERRRMGRRWADDSMDIDEEEDSAGDGLGSEDSEADSDESEEVKALKARRRYLRGLLSQTEHQVVQRSRPPRQHTSRKAVAKAVPLDVHPGYTILVVDTNILLSSLSMLATVIESMRWTVVIPLPVIMELDGLATNNSPLGMAASNALSYITAHLRSHSTSLKVQTSKGNYLTSLNVRTEQVDFSHGDPERNMDDLILKAAIWQEEHWVDRSAMLGGMSKEVDKNAIKVVLLSLDRNLRVKARARQLPAASEKDLAAILTPGT